MREHKRLGAEEEVEGSEEETIEEEPELNEEREAEETPKTKQPFKRPRIRLGA
ncbi:MAG: hypothetical protein KJ767_04090 [Nanoarchaeota archaeon]|nr:hypothetical protein [Nanoarchaeota archaeon]